MMLKMALGTKHILFDFKSGFEIADFFDLQLTLLWVSMHPSSQEVHLYDEHLKSNK